MYNQGKQYEKLFISYIILNLILFVKSVSVQSKLKFSGIYSLNKIKNYSSPYLGHTNLLKRKLI